MNLGRYVLIIGIIFILPVFIFASEISSSITGIISDYDLDQPISHVNIFLANTTIGTTSDSSGFYAITDIPAGMYTLVFQHVGYEIKTYDLVLRKSEQIVINMTLVPIIMESEAIEIIGIDPERWQENYEIFEEEFIGDTDNAYECTILNPEILQFDLNTDTNMLTATTDSILRIENLALGYTIDLVLVQFKCNLQGQQCEYLIYTKYNDIQTIDKGIQQIWQNNRKQCYMGSLQHFFSSLIKNRIEENDFILHTGSIAGLWGGHGLYLDPIKLGIDQELNSPFYKIHFDNAVSVSYVNLLPRPFSILEFTDEYTVIDTLGNLLTPFSLTVHGTWSKYRIADTLPFNYQP